MTTSHKKSKPQQQDQPSQIQAALQANLSLQNNLRKKYEDVSTKKQSNRLQVVQLLQQLSLYSSISNVLERSNNDQEREYMDKKEIEQFYQDLYERRKEWNDEQRKKQRHTNNVSLLSIRGLFPGLVFIFHSLIMDVFGYFINLFWIKVVNNYALVRSSFKPKNISQTMDLQ